MDDEFNNFGHAALLTPCLARPPADRTDHDDDDGEAAAVRTNYFCLL